MGKVIRAKSLGGEKIEISYTLLRSCNKMLTQVTRLIINFSVHQPMRMM